MLSRKPRQKYAGTSYARGVGGRRSLQACWRTAYRAENSFYIESTDVSGIECPSFLGQNGQKDKSGLSLSVPGRAWGRKEVMVPLKTASQGSL